MGRWNPWAELKSSPWITLQYADIDGADATTVTTNDGGYIVTLAHRLSRRQRKVALAHELVHIDIGQLWPRGTAGHIIMRSELIVDRRVAERLVPEAELRPFVKRRLDLGEMCLARDVAEEFDVTPDVADRALRLLEDRMRSNGVVERARAERRSA